MVAATVAGVEGEARCAEAGGESGLGLGVEFADEVPGLGVERGIGARGARERGLIDEDDLGERLVAGDGLYLRGVLGELASLGEEALVDDLVEQGGFARAGYAGEGDETLEWQRDGQVAKIVLGGAGESEPRVFGRDWAARGGRGNRAPAGKVGSGEGVAGAEEGGKIALENQVAALGAGNGADFEDVVCGADHGLVVLDEDDGVAGLGERADDFDQPVDIAGVKAYGRFIEDEQRVHERGAEAGGEADAHGLSAGEGFAGAVQGEVAEADLEQIAQAGEDGLVGEVG